MRKIIPMAIAMALIGTSVQAATFEFTTAQTPKQIRDCMLASLLEPSDTNVVELDGGYAMSQKYVASGLNRFTLSISPANNGSIVSYRGAGAGWRKRVEIQARKCAGL